jgi:hypothetical protein
MSSCNSAERLSAGLDEGRLATEAAARNAPPPSALRY